MINKHLMIEISKIATKNISLAIVDNISLGLGSGIKNTADEIKEYAELCNDALYHMQIKTFLETIDLNQDEVNKFFNDNPDNQRLGVEIFKILEQTYVERQGRMIARAFKLLAVSKIDRLKFDKLVHIITRLNPYLISSIENISPDDGIFDRPYDPEYEYIGPLYFLDSPTEHDPEIEKYERKLNSFFHREFQDFPQDFIDFEFLKAETVELTMDMTQIPPAVYKPTKDFLWFLSHIFRDTYKKVPTE
ncbi:hypothetical protein V8P79_08515 [Acinetobacter baumannii]